MEIPKKTLKPSSPKQLSGLVLHTHIPCTQKMSCANQHVLLSTGIPFYGTIIPCDCINQMYLPVNECSQLLEFIFALRWKRKFKAYAYRRTCLLLYHNHFPHSARTRYETRVLGSCMTMAGISQHPAKFIPR